MDNLHSVFVIGESRTNADNAITKMYGTFYMAFEVEETTFEILDFSCTHTIATTQDFLRRLFLGQTFPEVDNWLEDAKMTASAGEPICDVLHVGQGCVGRLP